MKHQSELLSQNIGIDISKDNLDTVISTIDIKRYVKVKASRQFSNTTAGFERLHKWILSKRIVDIELKISLEATGSYHEKLVWYLYQMGYQVSVILPLKAKRYFQAIGQKSKDDNVDAKGLSRMGLEQCLPLWDPISPNIYHLRSVTRQLEAYNHQRTSLINQLHALGQCSFPISTVERSLKRMLKSIEKEIVYLEKETEKIIRADSLLHERVKKVTSIKGVGTKTVAILLAETNGFANIKNQGQLVSYAGYDIVKDQSGKRTGKDKISKKGNAHIRRAMHMPSLTAVRHKTPGLSNVHKRLIDKGKKKMQAYVAVQRKMLILIWTLWRKNETFDPEFVQRGKHDIQDPENTITKGIKEILEPSMSKISTIVDYN